MLNNAIFITEEPNVKNNRKFDSYRYYVVGLNIDGVSYTAKIVIGVKQGKKYYDHRLTQIEKSRLIDNINQPTLGFTTEENASLPPYAVGKDTKLISILQTNSSKVVDENGEPLVVYHGFIGGDFNIFDKDVAVEHSRSVQPVYGSFFFSDTRKQAEEYGSFFRNGERVFNGIKATFLNIKNPFILNSEDATYHSVRGYFKNRDTREIDWSRGGIVKDGWEIGVQDITIAAMEEGYDGVIFRNIDDAGSEELAGTTHTTLAVFSPTQIKSATDNVGTFDRTTIGIIRYCRNKQQSPQPTAIYP